MNTLPGMTGTGLYQQTDPSQPPGAASSLYGTPPATSSGSGWSWAQPFQQAGQAVASAIQPAAALAQQQQQQPAAGPGGADTGQPGVLSTPGYGESWYQMYGNDINQPTNTQKLFDQGVGRTNPIYDNAIDMTNRQINAQTAARGIYDSSAALGSIGLADSNLRAAQVKDYEDLGQAADAANQGAYTAGSGAANAAQNQTENRISTIVGGQEKLSADQANVVSNFYDMAQKGQLTADMASIEAQIQASGVDAATAQALTNDILQAGGIVAKASTGK